MGELWVEPIGELSEVFVTVSLHSGFRPWAKATGRHCLATTVRMLHRKLDHRVLQLSAAPHAVPSLAPVVSLLLRLRCVGKCLESRRIVHADAFVKLSTVASLVADKTA